MYMKQAKWGSKIDLSTWGLGEVNVIPQLLKAVTKTIREQFSLWGVEIFMIDSKRLCIGLPMGPEECDEPIFEIPLRRLLLSIVTERDGMLDDIDTEESIEFLTEFKATLVEVCKKTDREIAKLRSAEEARTW